MKKQKKQEEEMIFAQKELRKIIKKNYKPLKEEFNEWEFLRMFAKELDKQHKTIMMNCFLSGLIITCGVGISYSLFKILKLFGGISYLDAVLSVSFIGIFIMIARTIWDD